MNILSVDAFWSVKLSDGILFWFLWFLWEKSFVRINSLCVNVDVELTKKLRKRQLARLWNIEIVLFVALTFLLFNEEA